MQLSCFGMLEKVVQYLASCALIAITCLVSIAGIGNHSLGVRKIPDTHSLIIKEEVIYVVKTVETARPVGLKFIPLVRVRV